MRRTRILPRWLRRADAAAGRAVNARHTHPAVDRFWSGLSGFADRGVLWWTLAGVLAVTGRRRAAARGLLSLVAASGLTNLIAKQVFGGDRPLLADVPIGRRLPKHPVTPSFPSGHSASAAAFAAGVALERPRIGAALAPVALGVGYSRLHTGAHWMSDVVGGLALGAAVAGLGALVVPPKPGEPELPPRSGTDRALPASPDGAGLFIVVNRSSGTSVVRADPLPVIAERLPAAEVVVLDGDDPREVVQRGARAAPIRRASSGSAAATGRWPRSRTRRSRPACRCSSCPAARSTTSPGRRARHPWTSRSTPCSVARAFERMSRSSPSATTTRSRCSTRRRWASTPTSSPFASSSSSAGASGSPPSWPRAACCGSRSRSRSW